MKKNILIVLSLVLLIGGYIVYRSIKYQDFFGKFVSENGSGYYQFNLYNWIQSSGGNDELKCDLWSCNITKGKLYYVKNNKIYMRMDSTGVFISEYKLEKKDDNIYLHFYTSDGEIGATYVKEKK